jgi:TIR domain
VMFGAIGGLAAFGLVGVFVGPALLGVAMAIWREWAAQLNLGKFGPLPRHGFVATYRLLSPELPIHDGSKITTRIGTQEISPSQEDLMPGVFLSHSSHDKHFVRRLAAALLAEGIPVWLDSWEMDIGDSLEACVQSGIDASTLFVLTISQKSIESGWVEKEVRLALAQESRVGRKLVFPIKIDRCSPPQFIDERIYVDFASGFSGPLKTLVSALEKHGARSLVPEPHREIICLSFTNQTNFDRAAFFRNREAFTTRQPGELIRPEHIKAINDPEYIALTERLHSRIDNIATDRWWTPSLEHELKNIPETIRRAENVMLRGAACLANANIYYSNVREAFHWFLKIARSRLCYELYSCQDPEDSVLNYGSDCDCSLSDSKSMARFYQVEKVFQVDVRSTRHNWKYETIFIGTDQLREKEMEQSCSLPYAGGLADFFYTAAFGRYVLPQVLYLTLTNGTHEEVWREEDIIVGPH